MEKALVTGEKAFDTARAIGDRLLLARSALAYGDASFLAASPNPRSSEFLKAALAELKPEDKRLRSLLLAMLPRARWLSAGPEEKVQWAKEAMSLADELGDKSVKAAALNGMHWALWGPETVEERLAVANELLALAKEIDDKALVVTAHTWRITDLLELGDVDSAYREIDAFEAIAEDLRQPTYFWWVAMWRAMRPLLEGRLEEAEQLALKALSQGQRAQAGGAGALFGVQTTDLRWKQGRLAELEGPIRNLIEQSPEVPVWRCALALVLVETGKEDEARKVFGELAESGSDLPRDANWLVSVLLLGDVCHLLEHVERAEPLYEMLLPYSERCIVTGIGATVVGSASRPLGSLAGLLGRWDEAERHFEHALEMNIKIRARPWVALTQWAYARMLVRRGRAEDKEKALELLTGSLDTSQELGMQVTIERCLALKLELQGVLSTNTGASIDAVASLVYAEKPDLRSQAAPDGTVTLLFSDIEGSTAKTEELGDQRWMEVLGEHNAIVREQLASHDGFEVKSEGDGFMLAFQSARKALQCAIGMQKAFAERDESADVTIKVRMGLHTGEVIKEGDDFFGKHVNLAARIAGQASGGEILVSSLLKELTASGGDITFEDGREVELKGLSGTQQVYRVGWEK
jgi:class 3 adenylate cyclase